MDRAYGRNHPLSRGRIARILASARESAGAEVLAFREARASQNIRAGVRALILQGSFASVPGGGALTPGLHQGRELLVEKQGFLRPDLLEPGEALDAAGRALRRLAGALPEAAGEKVADAGIGAEERVGARGQHPTAEVAQEPQRRVGPGFEGANPP